MEAVIDTNVWLDWLVFDDPAVSSLARARSRGGIRLPALARMREELLRVLHYPKLALDAERRIRALEAFDRWSDPQEPVAPAPLVCRDPDDQMFLDLALARRSGWLVSRDRQLLVLRRRAAHMGLRIVRPDDPSWLAALDATADL